MKIIRTIRIILVLFIIRLGIPGNAAGEITATIGEIIISQDTFNGQDGYRFSIKDVHVYGAKSKKLHFGFNIYQDKWLKNEWKSQVALVVPYDETYWADGGWFFYDYNYHF